jgi:hypothetical protein
MMGVESLHLFDSEGRVRDIPGWHLYAAFFFSPQQQAYVKVGISSIPYQRISALLTACPFRFAQAIFTPMGERRSAAKAESAVHDLLEPFGTRGEWFAMNLSDAAHKDAFHRAMRLAIGAETGRPPNWRQITPEQLSAYRALSARSA